MSLEWLTGARTDCIKVMEMILEVSIYWCKFKMADGILYKKAWTSQVESIPHLTGTNFERTFFIKPKSEWTSESVTYHLKENTFGNTSSHPRHKYALLSEWENHSIFQTSTKTVKLSEKLWAQ